MLLAAAAIVRVVPEVMVPTSTAATISLSTVASAPFVAAAPVLLPAVVVAVAVLVKVAVAPIAALVPAVMVPVSSPRALPVPWPMVDVASAPTDVAVAVLVPRALA